MLPRLFVSLFAFALAAINADAQTTGQIPKFQNPSGQLTNSVMAESSGSITVAGNLSLTATSNYFGLKRSSDGAIRTALFNGAILSDPDYLDFGALPNGFKFLSSSNSTLLTVQNGGNVAIGSAAPNSLFDVQNGVLTIGGTSTSVGSANRPQLELFNASSSLSIIRSYNHGTSAYGDIGIGETSRLIVQGSSGNVGIGDANPQTRLWVNGEATITGSSADLRLAPRSGYGTTMLFYNPSGTDLRLSGYFQDLVTFLSTGNVGFGTTSPKATVAVAGGVGAANQIGILGNAGSLANRPGLYLGSNGNFNGSGATAYFGLTAAPPGHDNDFALVGSSDPNTHRNLLIGYNTNDDPSLTFNPKVTIDTYSGDITTAGSITGAKVINAVFQDVAEWVPATEALPPGTVVVLNPAKGSQVAPSRVAYDTTVAGVVSEHPGIVLGVETADKAQIATTGRVRVKVDASRNPIRVGDLLVTSNLAGTAMRSVPVDVAGIAMHRPGTIVGKALEPLENGTGEILVLLSLQ
jgi:hypothetical protein